MPSSGLEPSPLPSRHTSVSLPRAAPTPLTALRPGVFPNTGAPANLPQPPGWGLQDCPTHLHPQVHRPLLPNSSTTLPSSPGLPPVAGSPLRTEARVEQLACVQCDPPPRLATQDIRAGRVSSAPDALPFLFPAEAPGLQRCSKSPPENPTFHYLSSTRSFSQGPAHTSPRAQCPAWGPQASRQPWTAQTMRPLGLRTLQSPAII